MDEVLLLKKIAISLPPLKKRYCVKDLQEALTFNIYRSKK